MTQQAGTAERLRRGLAVAFLNRYVVLGVNFFSTTILARLVAPAETGLFSVAASVVLLAQAIRDFGIAEFLVQERDLTPQKIRTAFGLTLMLAWTLGLIIFLLRNAVASLYGTPQLANLIAIVCCSFIVAPFSSTVLALLNREMAFNALLRISLASSLANATVSISLAWFGYGAMALSLGMVAMSVTTAVGAIPSARSLDHYIPSLREWRALASFGAFISSSNVISQSSARLPDLVIGRVVGFQALGLYNRASGIVSIFNEMVVSAVQTVAFPAFAAAHRSGHDLRIPYLRTVTLMTSVGFPLLAQVALNAKPLVLCLLGQSWIGVIPLIPPLAVSYAEALAVPMVGLYLIATGWVRIVPRLAIALQVCQVLSICSAVRFGIYWIAMVSVAYGFINLILNAHYLKKATGICLPELMAASARSAAVAAACAGPTIILNYIPALQNRPWLSLLACAAVGSITWIAAVFSLRHPVAKEVRLLLSTIRRSLFCAAM